MSSVRCVSLLKLRLLTDYSNSQLFLLQVHLSLSAHTPSHISSSALHFNSPSPHSGAALLSAEIWCSRGDNMTARYIMWWPSYLRWCLNILTTYNSVKWKKSLKLFWQKIKKSIYLVITVLTNASITGKSTTLIRPHCGMTHCVSSVRSSFSVSEIWTLWCSAAVCEHTPQDSSHSDHLITMQDRWTSDRWLQAATETDRLHSSSTWLFPWQHH